MATAIGRQWLIFELSGQAYGVDVRHMREIVSLRDMHIHGMPQASSFIEGVVLLRDEPIDVLDVRTLLGLVSLHEETREFSHILEEREADHCKWLKELDSCVAEQREFRLATNPHKCKFGQWYDSLLANKKEFSKFTNDDLTLVDLFAQLDQPHKNIHAIAERVIEKISAGDVDAAKMIVEQTRDTDLSSLRRTFSKCREQLETARSGLLFVLRAEDSTFGALVDRVAEVVNFAEDEIRSIDNTGYGKDLIAGVAQWGEAGKTVLLLNVPEIARMRLCEAGVEMACTA